jgi:hypothetical protein
VIEEHHIDRIHRDAEGTATPQESEALREYLAEHPEARALREDLGHLFRILEQEPEIDPPPRLRADVIRAVRSSSRRGETRRRGRTALGELIRGRPRLRTTYAFAFGLAVGILIFALVPVREESLDRTRLSGTLVKEADPAFAAGDRQELGTGDVTGAVTARQSGEEIRIDLMFEARTSVEVVVEFDEATLDPLGFTRDGAGEGSAALDSNRFRITNASEGRYRLRFARRTSEGSLVHVRVLGEGTRIERELRISPDESGT